MVCGFSNVAISEVMMFPLLQRRPFYSQVGPTYTAPKTTSWVPRAMTSTVAGERADFSKRYVSVNEPVIPVDWLHANLKEPNLKVPDLTRLEKFVLSSSF